MTDLDVLQTVRLKGRTTAADLAAALGDDPAASIERLAADGLMVPGTTLRLTPDGRARLAVLLAEERSAVDAAAADAAYTRFTPINAEFKAALSQWQLARADRTGDGAAQDAAMLATVEDVHGRVVPVVAAAGDLSPRLHRYAERLAEALRKATDGDLTWLSRPLVDSYHTVWFELHEELIGLAGRVRDSD